MSFGYRRVYAKMWREPAFRALSPEGKLAALYLVSGQSNRLGLYVLSEAQAAEDLGLTPETFRERLREVLGALKWQYDEVARVLFIPSWWRDQAPENPNVLIGSLRDLEEVPETALIEEFFSNIDPLKPSLRQVLQERSANVRATLLERSVNKEKEKKQGKEKGQKKDTRDAPAALDEEFEQHIWNPYPMRKGKKLGKMEAFTKWKRLCEEDKGLLAIAVKNLAADASKNNTLVKDLHRFIRNSGGNEPWREWVEPATTGGIHENLNGKDYRAGIF